MRAGASGGGAAGAQHHDLATHGTKGCQNMELCSRPIGFANRLLALADEVIEGSAASSYCAWRRGGVAARRARAVSQDAVRRLLRHAAARGAALCGFRESSARNAFELPEAAFEKRFSDG
jgi:hypothetical protein